MNGNEANKNIFCDSERYDINSYNCDSIVSTIPFEEAGILSDMVRIVCYERDRI